MSEPKAVVPQHPVPPEEPTHALVTTQTPEREAARGLDREALSTETPAYVLITLSLPHDRVAPAPASSRHPPHWQLAGVLLAVLAIGLITFARHHKALPPRTTGLSNPAAASTYSVSNFPNNFPFELSGEEVRKILRGGDTSKIAVYAKNLDGTDPAMDGWRLVKYDGHIYLRGWIPAPPTRSAFPRRTIDIDDYEQVPENGDRPAEVTLRLDALKYDSFYERISTFEAASFPPGVFRKMDQKLTVSAVQLDQHAWERAEHVMSTKEPVVPSQMAQQIMKRKWLFGRPNPLLFRFAGGTSIASYPDEKMFVLGYEALSGVLTGAPLAAVDVSPLRPDLAHPAYLGCWFGVKHHGELYLRGWIAGDLGQKELTGPFLHLYNSPAPPELGGAARPISLRLKNVQYGPGGRFYSSSWDSALFGKPGGMDSVEQTVLSDVQPDDHAWEKW